VSEEIELKLAIAPEALDGVLKAAPLRARKVRFKPARQLVTAYFDTSKGALRDHGVFLRVRQDGTRFTQAVKTSGAGGLLAERGEWEWPLASAKPDLALAAETGLKPLVKRAKKGGLTRVFASEITRRVAKVGAGDSVLELALDRGLVRAGRRTQALCELEIEVKAGPVAPLFALARDLAALPGVSVGFATKASRGFALASGRAAGAVKAAEVALDPAMSPGLAAAAILDSCAAQAAANLPAVTVHRLPEGVHQLRVALRRLRAALSVFQDVLPAGRRKPLRHEAGWLAGVLGPARDLDVMTGGVLKAAAAPAALADDMRRLARVLAQARRVAWGEAVAAVASPRATLMLLNLSETSWTLRHDLPDPAAPPLEVFATAQLEQRFESVLAAGADIETMDIEARHELRLALKKLRYAADFFACLYPRKAAKSGIKVLASLQDALGGFNDAVSVDAILARAVAAAPAKNREPLQRASLFVSGWAAHRGTLAWGEARACWAAFAEEGAFWR
jgi:inorganic triphosphatase YgiF